MALTFQKIKDSYENSDLHIHVTKLPVSITLRQADLKMLNVDFLWPDPDQEYAEFDLAYVAELDEENAISSDEIISKGFFISKPGADFFVELNDMTNSEETKVITDLLALYVNANFFTKDGNLKSSESKLYILDLLKFYLCYDCGKLSIMKLLH